MVGKVQHEIKQKRPFHSLEEETLITVQRTADALARANAEVLKEAGITATQYNVLRILRGAGAEGLACGEIGDRLVTRDPDVTRLLDRMERMGLVGRRREQKDRRVITIRVTPKGLKLVNSLDQPMGEAIRRTLGHMGEPRLRSLIQLLDEARAPAG